MPTRCRSLPRARSKVEATATDWVSAGTDWVQIRIGVAKQHPRRYTPCEWLVAGAEEPLDLSQARRSRPSNEFRLRTFQNERSGLQGVSAFMF